MRYVRWTIAWALFWAGHVVSRPMNVWRLAIVLYPIYNRLMGWSSEVQGAVDFGPWRHVGKDGGR